MERNKNYTKDGIFIIVEGQEYPLLKTSNKMAFYMKDDEIKRIKIEKVNIKEGGE
jgi:hypothetical protein